MTTGRGRTANVPTEPHYVSVDLFADESGHTAPTAIHWDDGRVFPIERIVRIEPLNRVDRDRSRTGKRYTVQVAGKEKQLFHNADGSGRWFVRVPIRYIHDELCQIPPRDLADWPACWTGAPNSTVP